MSIFVSLFDHFLYCNRFRPGGVLPYMGYIGMCGAEGYGFFLAVLVINRVSLLAILPPFW